MFGSCNKCIWSQGSPNQVVPLFQSGTAVRRQGLFYDFVVLTMKGHVCVKCPSANSTVSAGKHVSGAHFKALARKLPSLLYLHLRFWQKVHAACSMQDRIVTFASQQQAMGKHALLFKQSFHMLFQTPLHCSASCQTRLNCGI